MAQDAYAAPASFLYAEYIARHPERDDESFERLCADHAAVATELQSLHVAYGVALAAVGGADPRPADPATRFPYPIIEEIGRGGMGIVYRVTDLALGRELALKCVRPHASRARFQRECRITARLDHPAIVPVHAQGEDRDGNPWFTMKLVRGENLRRIIERLHARDPAWSMSRAVGVVLRVCEAMDYAHARGVVHRDLKPENIMVGSFGEVHVMDWGLAGEFAGGTADMVAGRCGPPDATMTHDGDVIGTLHYMAPEQARGAAAIDVRMDVYSLGAILHHLLSGTEPHGVGLSVHELAARVRRGPPEPPAVSASVPAPLLAVCRRAMAADPALRYASPGELGADLRAWLEGRVVAAYESGPWATARRWIGRHRALSALGGLVVLALPLIGFLTAYALQATAAVDAQARAAALARGTELMARGFVAHNMGMDGRAQAERAFAQALELMPDSGLAAFGLARALRATAGQAAARQRLEDWLRTAPAGTGPGLRRWLIAMDGEVGAAALEPFVLQAGLSAADVFAEADHLMARTDRASVTRAAELMATAILRSPTPVFALYDALLRARTWLGDRASAVEVADAIAAHWPAAPAALVARAHALRALGDVNAALPLAQTAAASQPDWVVAQQAVALVALDGGQADLGLAAIAAAERLGALTLESLEIKANLLRVAGKVEAAEQVLRLALQRSDARAATWFHLNVVLMHAGRDAEALEAATTALALWQPAAMDVTFDYGGQHPKLLTNRGICLGRLGRLEEAEAALAEAVALGPHIATAWASLGAVRSMRGNTQGSIEAARRAVDLEPNNAQALNNLSSSLLDLGQAQEAHALLQRAVAAAPRHALAWRNLGIAECQLNRGEAGRAAFQQAFDLNPRNEDVVRRYADLLVNTGRATQALDVIATFRAKGGTASVALAQKEDWARSARDLEVALSDATWDAKTLLARARTEREHKRHWLSACCFARALREQPAWVTTHAVEAARAAIAGARFADLPQREELFALGAQWLRSRLEYLRAQPAGQGREEAANWNSQFPLGAAELLHVPEPTRPPWVQLASDLTLFLQSVGG